jgi:hypothetical protein
MQVVHRFGVEGHDRVDSRDILMLAVHRDPRIEAA